MKMIQLIDVAFIKKECYKIRNKHELNREQFSRLCGVSAHTIKTFENTKNEIYPSTLNKIITTINKLENEL